MVEDDHSRAGARGRLTTRAERVRLLIVAAALGAVAAAASTQPAHASRLQSAPHAHPPAISDQTAGASPRPVSASSAAAARWPEASAPWMELVSRWSPQT